jgi:hypothetical protein
VYLTKKEATAGQDSRGPHVRHISCDLQNPEAKVQTPVL